MICLSCCYFAQHPRNNSPCWLLLLLFFIAIVAVLVVHVYRLCDIRLEFWEWNSIHENEIEKKSSNNKKKQRNAKIITTNTQKILSIVFKVYAYIIFVQSSIYLIIFCVMLRITRANLLKLLWWFKYSLPILSLWISFARTPNKQSIYKELRMCLLHRQIGHTTNW